MPNPDPAPVPDPAVPPPNGADGALPIMELPPSGPRDERPGISDASPQELLSWFADRGEAAFRARPNQEAEDVEARLLGQGGEGREGVLLFHISNYMEI